MFEVVKAHLSLKMRQNLDSGFKYFVLLPRHEESQRLVLCVGYFDVGPRFLHDGAARLHRLALAEFRAAI